mmetsp:Transcript_78896/g.136776  ORF Transcript_78896/g.136776 Transcript_78896/m.136776 type:complete len:229 (-) Transcript_78896:68-754(-)
MKSTSSSIEIVPEASSSNADMSTWMSLSLTTSGLMRSSMRIKRRSSSNSNVPLRSLSNLRKNLCKLTPMVAVRKRDSKSFNASCDFASSLPFCSDAIAEQFPKANSAASTWCSSLWWSFDGILPVGGACCADVSGAWNVVSCAGVSEGGSVVSSGEASGPGSGAASLLVGFGGISGAKSLAPRMITLMPRTVLFESISSESWVMMSCHLFSSSTAVFLIRCNFLSCKV